MGKIILLFILVNTCLIPSSIGQKSKRDEIKEILQSDFIEGLYQRTYYSLLDRVDPDGFMQESLTGRYPGMFPRTVGGMVSLMLETGELVVSEKVISSTLNAMTENDMERIPHVFTRQTNDLLPIYNGKELMQSKTEDLLYKLDHQSKVSIPFEANNEAIRGVELAISLNSCMGTLTLKLSEKIGGEPIKTVKIDAKQVIPGRLWLRFDFDQEVKLTKGKAYFLTVDFDGFGYPSWYGEDENSEFGGAYILSGTSKKWVHEKNNTPAFLVDFGKLRHRQINKPYQIYDDWDQIDGQANVIMAWARLAEERGQTAFEDQTYSLVAKLMDRTSDQPYFMIGQGFPVGINLVQNIALEHSREGRYWHTIDILTQSVVGASLESMICIAERRNDYKHVVRWQRRLQILKKGVNQSLTRTVNNKKVYLEMLLPDSNNGTPFTGMGWLNLAPIMAQWEPLERDVMRNTINVMRDKLLLEYKGEKYLAMEFDPDGKVHKEWIIGKGVGWEIEYSRQEKEYNRIIDWLNFLQTFHTGELYSEFMLLENDKWSVGDGGNGEQSTWWCWAIARLRKDAGLPVVPIRE